MKKSSIVEMILEKFVGEADECRFRSCQSQSSDCFSCLLRTRKGVSCYGSMKVYLSGVSFFEPVS
jgi:hypothetical protein